MWEGCGVVRDAARLEGALRAHRASCGRWRARWTCAPLQKATSTWPWPSTCGAPCWWPRPPCGGPCCGRRAGGPTSGPTTPQLEPALTVSFRTRRNGEGELETAPVPVPPLPDELRALAEEEGELAVAGRLLE